MRRGEDFQSAIRRGSRAVARPLLVVHARAAVPEQVQPLVGFVVSKAVGGAVVRNRVRRRLRSAVRQTPDLPAGWNIVVRALPDAADASWPQLLAAWQQAWRGAAAKETERARHRESERAPCVG